MPLAGGHVERGQVGAAEAAVGWPVHRCGMGLQHLARRRENVDAGAGASLAVSGGGDDVALGVQGLCQSHLPVKELDQGRSRVSESRGRDRRSCSRRDVAVQEAFEGRETNPQFQGGRPAAEE